MKKRWIGLCTALMLLASVGAVGPLISGAAPADPVDLEETKCGLTVTLVNSADSDKADYIDDMKEAKITLDLYRVAGAKKVDGYDTYQFDPDPSGPFAELKTSKGKGIAEYSDLQSLTSEDWKELAQKAAYVVFPEEGTSPVKVFRSVENRNPADFSDLDAGLYLLVARDTNLDMSKYVKEINRDLLAGEKGTGASDQTWKVTIANSPRYEYLFMPQLIALPTKEAENGQISTSNQGQWLYNQNVFLKLDREPRYASLKIIKTLENYESVEGTIEPVTFVFRVVGTMPGENGKDVEVYNEVTSLNFTGPGTGQTTLDRIPATAKVTVEEIYKGLSYTQTVPDGNGTVVIASISAAPDAENQAEFKNVYNHNRTHGHGIKNQFVYNAEKDEWEWTADPSQPDRREGE